MKLEDLQKRIDQLITMADAVIATHQVHPSRSSGGVLISGSTSINTEKFYEWRAASLSFLDRLLGSEHILYKEFQEKTDRAQAQYARYGRGVLSAVKQEVDGGWLFTVRGIVSAEIFTDFLDMAGHLLQEGYKDPAAVMIGSVLEEHLRQLCTNNRIEIATPDTKTGKDIPKKADRMNNDLAGANIYNKLYQKSILGWLDLRNKAAHGQYGEYDARQVELMEAGVVDFIAKTS
jgi:hypothetical protein